MMTYQKYLVWTQRSREPALFTPLIRFWLCFTSSITLISMMVTGHQLIEDMPIWMMLAAKFFLIVAGAVFFNLAFQRLIGETSLGQGIAKFHPPSLLRVMVAAGVFGWASRNSLDISPLLFIPLSVLLAGLVFELTLGQLPFFKIQENTTLKSMESAA